MSATVLSTEAGVKRYGPFVAVAGVDLAIGEREIFGLVGPNGAGKTTTLRMLATCSRPAAGDGTDLRHRVGAPAPTPCAA